MARTPSAGSPVLPFRSKQIGGNWLGSDVGWVFPIEEEAAVRRQAGGGYRGTGRTPRVPARRKIFADVANALQGDDLAYHPVNHFWFFQFFSLILFKFPDQLQDQDKPSAQALEFGP
jgi:hypothetical protein